MTTLPSIRHSRDFERVYADGRRVRAPGLTVYAKQRDDENAPSRVGLAVKGRNCTAVERNRVRRRLRAMTDEGFPHRGWDLVVVAAPGSISRDFQEMKKQLVRAVGTATQAARP